MVAQLWHDVRYRLRALIQRRAFDRDLQAEIDAHVAHEASRYMRQGVPAPDAWRQARVAFGGVEAIKAETRDARGTALLESCLQDLRDAVRSLRARPAYALGATMTLAFGIGALAMAFTATKAVRIDPLPYPEPDRLVVIRPVAPGAPEQRLQPTLPEYVAWRDQSNLFEAVGTLGLVNGDLGPDVNGALAETVVVQQCSTSLLRALRVFPVLGRVFTAEEGEAHEKPRVAMIGYDLWQRRFAGTPDVIGRTLDLDGVATTIVGVMPDGASPQHNRVDVWAPIRLTPARLQGSGRGWPVIARLRPDVRLAEAQIETDVISARLARTIEAGETYATRVEPLRTALFGPYAYLTTAIEVVAAAVFFAACASVAGLFFMRATSRRQALAVRAAVGAGRGRLARQVVIEGAVVAMGAGIAAVGVAWVGLGLVSASPLPPLVKPAFDGPLLLFVITATVAAGALLSLLPAIYVWRVQPADAMRAHGRHTDSPHARRVRHTLVIGQIALATVMLVGAGLLATTVHRIRTNPIGGDPRGVVTFTVRYPPAQYRTDRGSYDGLPLFEVSPVPARDSALIRQRIEQLPGVTSAAVTSQVPFLGAGATVAFVVVDDPRGDTSPRSGAVQIVSSRFFETLRIPLLEGRDFTDHDTDTAPWSVIVNEAMAADLGIGRRPIGRTIHLALAPDERPRTIVGVVGNAKPTSVATSVPPTIYLPVSQLPTMGLAPRLAERLLVTFVARTTGDAATLVPDLRRVVAEVAPERLPGTFRPLESAIAWQVAARQQLLIVFGFLAATASLLAAVGVHGAIAHHMTDQARDIGVRIAFGARTSDLWRLTLGRLTRLLVPGVAIGVAAAMTLSPAMDDVVWGVSSGYAPVYVTAGLVIGTAAVAATALLVRRVLTAAPALALNAE